MKHTDWGWVSRELAAAKTGTIVNDAVVKLLESLRKLELRDDEERDALDKLQKLAAGHSIAEVPKDEKWGPVIPGDYKIRDTVRVKPSAYEGEMGTRHNGKRGRVVAARNGFVLVVYEGQMNADIQHRHRPENLQKLLKS